MSMKPSRELSAAQPVGLIRRAYRTLLKEAAYFDTHPLAKALLSASPYLRKDLSWISVVNRPPAHATSVTAFCGVPANTLAVPSPKSMRQFVREEFRHVDREWDGVRFFAWMRRLELAKTLHEKCSVSITPALPPVHPKLQLLTELSSAQPDVCSVGALLLAHPVLVDDFTQAVVLIVSNKAGRTAGITLNAPCGHAQLVLEEKRLAMLGVTTAAKRKLIKAANVRYLSQWPIFSGGPISSLPVILHRSAKLHRAAQQAAPRSTASTIAADVLPLPTGPVFGGWYLSPLVAVLTLDAKLVHSEVTAETARIVMNYSEWETSVLRTEILQNWWLATERESASAALGSLLEYPAPSEAAEEGSGKIMWQRAVANLGGDLSDFSRLTVIEEEDGDYRKLITDTFRDDLKKANRSSGPS